MMSRTVLHTESIVRIISRMSEETNPEIKISSAPSALGVAQQLEALFRAGKANFPALRRNEHLTAEVFDAAGGIIGGAYFIKYQQLVSIESFWVAEEHRGAKVGQKVYDAIEEFARSANCDYVVGTVPSYYPGALAFWRKQGGEVFGVLDQLSGQDQVFYVKKRISPL